MDILKLFFNTMYIAGATFIGWRTEILDIETLLFLLERATLAQCYMYFYLYIKIKLALILNIVCQTDRLEF